MKYEKVMVEEPVKTKMVEKYKCPECGQLEGCEAYVDYHRRAFHSFEKEIHNPIGGITSYYFKTEERFRLYTKYWPWKGPGWYCDEYDPEVMNENPAFVTIQEERELLQNNINHLVDMINEIDELETKK